MAARFTRGMYRGMTPAQAQDAEEFGDWGEEEPLEGSLDARGATPPPPAVLNPLSVLRNRRRTDLYLATGLHTWPRPNAQTNQGALS